MKIKSLFISDTHLGNPNSKADKILEILKNYEYDNLFIVGDFIDMTYMKKNFYWNQNHSNIIQKILKLSKKNINIIYLAGNHDNYIRFLIDDSNINIGNILLVDEYVYTTLQNERIIIVHGDCFDGLIKMNKYLYTIGDFAYEISIKLNNILNKVRKIFGYEYWSLSAYLKQRVKNVIKFLVEHKKLAIQKIKDNNCDSILQGHTHSPEISVIDGYHFYNSGDFVESCSYIIEDSDGNIKLEFVK